MVDLERKHSPVVLFFAKAAAIVLGLLVLGVCARVAYVRFWPDVLVHKARAALAKGDLRDAALSAQRAFQIRRTDVEAMRLMADISDQAGQYVALEWRNQVLVHRPDSLPDILACANTALHCGEPKVAKETLAKAANIDENAQYWAISASTDEYLGNLTAAEVEAAKAVSLDPENKDSQLTLASIQLKTRKLEVRDAARSRLQELANDPELRIAAQRLLLEDSVANHELGTASKLAETVVGEKESQFYDKVTYLGILNRSGDERFHNYLTELQAAAVASPANTGALLEWMRENGFKTQAYDWVKTLPASIIRTAEAGPMAALCYVDAAQWRELHEFVKDGSWGKSDYLRHAFLARAAEQLGNQDEFNLESNKALSESAADPRYERVLGEFELDWRWEGAAQRTLNAIVKTSDNQEYLAWALNRLYNIYTGQRNLDQLLAVTQKIAELSPNDDDVQNNFVMFSLLAHTNVLAVCEKADDLYKRHPAGRTFVSTYAYSLLVRGNAAAAERAIMSLPEEDRRDSSIAPYCGIILAANKQKEAAKVYLDLVDPARLLPQEIALVDKARNQVR